MRTLETKENKNVCLHVHVCEWWEVLRDVRDGIADFGMATEIPDDGLHHDLIITSPHRLIVPSKHDIKEPVSMKDLAGQTVVCMHTASGPIAIEHQLRAQNIQARIITVATASQVLAWLSRGLGIGFLPECMVPDDGRFSKLHTAFALIDAFDSLYKRKCIDGEERSFGDEQEPLPSPAERIYSNIKDYWSPKK
jgi:DNA-binding transcriptional LysR family regulator